MSIDFSLNVKAIQSLSETELFLQNGLELVDELMLDQVEQYHPDLVSAVQLVLSAGGKRIRPKLILLIGKLLNAPNEPLIHLASAIEMLHTATLVHDDLIDGSLLRRGKETINSMWSPAATVLVGDFLFAAASDLASRTHSVEVMSLISRSLMTIVDGEVNQLFRNRRSLTFEDYYRVIYAKTASLFETSTHATAVVSEANSKNTEALRKFGCNLGMAFQIIDDILDYSGKELTAGKPMGMDLRQGLVTLPLLFYMKNNPNDPIIKKLRNGLESLNPAEIDYLMQIIPASNALQEARKEAKGFVLKAEACLKDLPSKHERALLIDITRDSMKRKF